MAYEQLNSATVVDYVKNLPEMAEVFSPNAALKASEIGDGNLNYVYIIENENNNDESVILKQAVPYLRCVGESFPLSTIRMEFETKALKAQYKLASHAVPKIYHANSQMSLVIMQNLSSHKILRAEIIQGKTFPKFAEQISSFLANTLFYTSDFYLSSAEKKSLQKEFVNTELCALTEDFVFSHPYEENETNAYNEKLSQDVIDSIQKDAALKTAVGMMKYKFMTNAQALIHGDLHIGSIMANEQETYVIDPEFAFYGPMGFDIGALLGNLLMSYFSHEYRQKLLGSKKPHLYRQWLLETIETVWREFASKFKENWLRHEVKTNSLAWAYEGGQEALELFIDSFLKELFTDTLGFAACKMMRRIVGLAKVADIAEIEDLEARALIEEKTIKLARQMILNKETINTIEEVTALAKALSPLEGN